MAVVLEVPLAVRGRLKLDEPLAPHTSLGVGGPAAYFVEPADADDVVTALAFARARGLPWYLLGNGTNTLFPDEGYPGVVIHLGPGSGLSRIALREGRLTAQAGAPLAAVRRAGEARGLDTLGFLVGIPGTLGGALAMNAGIPEAAIGDWVQGVTALDAQGRLRRLDREGCGFAYRTSRLRQARWIALEATLELDPRVSWDRAALRKRRARQPRGRSPGCVFKNPPDLPHSAGWLIDKSGLKGYKVGNAQVSRCHANFILNRGGARSADVLALIDIVRNKVYKEFKVELDLELEVVLN